MGFVKWYMCCIMCHMHIGSVVNTSIPPININCFFFVKPSLTVLIINNGKTMITNNAYNKMIVGRIHRRHPKHTPCQLVHISGVQFGPRSRLFTSAEKVYDSAVAQQLVTQFKSSHTRKMLIFFQYLRAHCWLNDTITYDLYKHLAQKLILKFVVFVAIKTLFMDQQPDDTICT